MNAWVKSLSQMSNEASQCLNLPSVKWDGLTL